MWKKIIPVIVLLLSAWFGQDLLVDTPRAPTAQAGDAAPSSATEFRSGAQVRGEGVVQRVLADDNDGSRHQRFILQLDSGRTVLVAHNIDLAPRIAALRKGDTVLFFGQFETNDRGGVIHWTHHDPQGSHPDGWLKHQGRTYQ